MKISPYQACQTTEGWVPVDIPSETRVNHEGHQIVYRVMVCPWQNPAENICECYGYLYQGRCKHQEMAQAQVCGWTELQVAPPEMKPKHIQTPEQRKGKVCPRCGGPTMWRMEVEDGDES